MLLLLSDPSIHYLWKGRCFGPNTLFATDFYLKWEIPVVGPMLLKYNFN